MILNQYLGGTQYKLGASMLNVNPVLKIREGYQVGASIEYVDLGKFPVTTVQNFGYDSQKLNLNASKLLKTYNLQRRTFPAIIKQRYSYFNDFNDPTTISDFSFTNSSYWGITQGLLMRGPSMPEYFSYAVLNDSFGLENYVVTAQMKGSHIATDTYGAMGIGIKMQTVTEVLSPARFADVEAVWFIKEAGWMRLCEHIYLNGGYNQSYSGSSLVFVNNQNYVLRVIVNGNRIQAAYGTAGVGPYTELLNTGTSERYLKGGVGFATYSNKSGEIKFDWIRVEETGNQRTRSESLNYLIRENDMTLSEPVKNAGFSDFTAGAGSTFNLGVTNGYQQLDLVVKTSGNSWNTVWTNGATFNDFVAEVEMKIGSSNWAGVGVLGPSAWWGAYHTDRNDGAVSVEYFAAGRSGTGYDNYYLGYNKDVWVKYKLVKSGPRVDFYINNTYVANAGLSQAGYWGASVKIGFFSYRIGLTNTVVSYRNFQIKQLDDTIKGQQYSSMETLGADLNRYTPTGWALKQAGETVVPIQKGVSYAVVGITNWHNSTESEMVTGVNKFVYVKGNEVASIKQNDDIRARKDGSFAAWGYINDTNLTSKDAVEATANYKLYEDRKAYSSYTVSLLNYLLLEKYDLINWQDIGLGTSRVVMVDAFNKRLNVEGGDFGEDIILVDL